MVNSNSGQSSPEDLANVPYLGEQTAPKIRAAAQEYIDSDELPTNHSVGYLGKNSGYRNNYIWLGSEE